MMGMGWMWIIWLLVLVLVGIVLLVVLAVRAFGGGVHASGSVTRGPVTRSRARAVLDERYARGDLTTEEYRERLTALGEDGTG